MRIAAAEGQVAVVRLLLNHGARISKDTLAGQTELQLAAKRGHVEVVRLLLERGTDSTVKMPSV